MLRGVVAPIYDADSSNYSELYSKQKCEESNFKYVLTLRWRYHYIALRETLSSLNSFPPFRDYFSATNVKSCSLPFSSSFFLNLLHLLRIPILNVLFEPPLGDFIQVRSPPVLALAQCKALFAALMTEQVQRCQTYDAWTPLLSIMDMTSSTVLFSST